MRHKANKWVWRVSLCDYSYGQWNHEQSSVRLDWLLSPGIRRTPIVDTSSQRRPTNQNQFRRSSLPWRQSCIDSTHTYPAPKLEIAIMCITLWQVHFGKAGMFSRYVCCVAIAISIRVHHFNQHKSRNQHSGRQDWWWWWWSAGQLEFETLWRHMLFSCPLFRKVLYACPLVSQAPSLRFRKIILLRTPQQIAQRW